MNEDVLRKVRALLSLAERAGTPAEAEAASARAEALIAKYAIEQALLESAAPVREEPVVRRVMCTAPYARPKVSLLSAVAHAHGVRAFYGWAGDGARSVSLVGFRTDLDTVELLYTSLSVQAMHAVLAQGRSDCSFRASFHYGFAAQVGARLRKISQAARREADEVRAGAPSVALALRDRADAVESLAERSFPGATTRRVSVGSGSGYAQGVAAGDRADVGQGQLGGSRRALA